MKHSRFSDEQIIASPVETASLQAEHRRAHRAKPAETGPLCPLQIFMHRALAQPQALTNRALRQPVAQSQSQNFAHLLHRQFLARHLDPLLLGKGPTLPSVENCQSLRLAAAVTSMIMIT